MAFLFTSEAVSEGHPDKISDQISDAILDEFLRRDREAKVACETLCTTGLVVVAGEVRSDAYVDVQEVARRVINRIGYTKSEYMFDGNSCGVLSAIHEQSPDINQGVVQEEESAQGAGDQGIMFGYATNETPEMLPIPYVLATEFLKLLKNYPSRMFRADAKAQVSFDYDSGRITTFLCSVQHSPDVEVGDFRHIISIYSCLMFLFYFLLI